MTIPARFLVLSRHIQPKPIQQIHCLSHCHLFFFCRHKRHISFVFSVAALYADPFLLLPRLNELLRCLSLAFFFLLIYCYVICVFGVPLWCNRCVRLEVVAIFMFDAFIRFFAHRFCCTCRASFCVGCACVRMCVDMCFIHSFACVRHFNFSFFRFLQWQQQ